MILLENKMSGFAEIACQTDPDFTGTPFNNFFSGIIQKDGLCEAFTQVDSAVKNETFPDPSALLEIQGKKRKKSQQRASIYNQSLQILMTALKSPNTPQQQQQVISILEQNPSLMVRLARGQANQQQQGQPGGPQHLSQKHYEPL